MTSDENVQKVQALVEKDEAGGSKRRLSGPLLQLAIAIGALMSLYHLVYVGGFLARLDIYIFPNSHRVVGLMFAMVLGYLTLPATKKSSRTGLPWYDVVAIILSLVVNLYLIINYRQILLEVRLSPGPLERVLGTIALILILELCRRAIGLALSIIGLAFYIYPLVGAYAPGIWQTSGASYERVIDFTYFYPQGIYGDILHLTGTVIIVFLIFGAFLQASGGGRFFIDFALGVAGRFRGGPAKVAVIASSMFGSISGSSIANVATTGVLTIPLMKKIGYRPHFAGAVEAAASNGGQLMPPVMGIAAFLMIDFLRTSYLNIIIAATIPALLYYFALLIMVDLEAAKTGLKGLPRQDVPLLGGTLGKGWIYLLPIALVIGLIIVLKNSPETAAIYATFVLVVISWLRKDVRMGPRRIYRALALGAEQTPMVFSAAAIAGILTMLMQITGLGMKLSSILVAAAGGNLAALLIMVAIGCIIMGMGMPTSAVYILGAIFMAPALVLAGMKPIAAHFFVFYFGLAAMVTPPVCLAAYVGAAIANASFWKTGWEAMRLSIVVYLVPFMMAVSPSLLMVGSPVEIVSAALTALIGIVFLTAGLQGFLFTSVGWMPRLLFIAGGVLLIVPVLWISIIGIGIGIIPLLWQLRWLFATRRAKRREAVASPGG